MNFRKTVAILALAISGLVGNEAPADVITMVDAVETITANINVPTSTNGRLMFKACSDTCDEDFIAARLTPETLFWFNGQRMNFAEFRANFFNLRRGSDTYALVSYDTNTKTVTSLNVGT